MKYLVPVMAIIIHLFCIFLGGILFYQWLTVGIGIEGVLLKPAFILLSVLGIIAYVQYDFSDNPKYIPGIAIWGLAMTLTFATLKTYNYLRNRSENILITKFYWDSGIDLYLRQNGSYKVVNTDWMSGYVSYGRYRIKENHIITNKNLNFGTVEMIDTLTLTSDSLHVYFRLNEEWKGISEGEMLIEMDSLFKKSSIDL